MVIKQQINDKVKHRLQQIDEYEENVSEHRGLSQDDYIKIITQISEELQEAWRLDQRVKALKIVIQVQVKCKNAAKTLKEILILVFKTLIGYSPYGLLPQ